MAKKKNPPKSAVVTAATLELQKRRDALGAERDKLQSMIDDLTALHESCEEAIAYIEDAVQAMSRYA